MDSGRVGVCHRLENKRRQFLIVVNDVVKTKQNTYTELVEKDKANADFRFEKSKMFVRRALVRQRVLQQCMRMRRSDYDHSPHKNLYGRYGGRTIDQFGREIETFIAMNHPKIRRQRKIRQLLEDGKAQGKLLEEKAIASRMQSFLQRSITKMRLKQLQKERSKVSIKRENSKLNYQRQGLPKLPVLTNPFFTSNRYIEGNDTDADKTANDGIKASKPKKASELDLVKLSGDLGSLKLNENVMPNRTDDQQIKTQKAKDILKEFGQGKTDIQVDDSGPRTLLVLPPIKPKEVLVQD